MEDKYGVVSALIIIDIVEHDKIIDLTTDEDEEKAAGFRLVTMEVLDHGPTYSPTEPSYPSPTSPLPLIPTALHM